VSSVDVELALTALAAMLSPTALPAVFALALGERPLRTGSSFFLGAFGVTLIIGIAAAFVLGGTAASSSNSSTPQRGSRSSMSSPVRSCSSMSSEHCGDRPIPSGGLPRSRK
jgi:hypothetical protein